MAIIGLPLFKERFHNFSERYVLIGGTACFLAMEQVGVEFRATKDLDIVLIIEAMDQALAIAICDFIREGAYEIRDKSPGHPQFYRFSKPKTPGFPVMIELFSRAGDALDLTAGQQTVPVIKTVDAEGDPLNLSALLLDDTYYAWIQAGRMANDGLPFVRAEHLIPLKTRAWIDLSARRSRGEHVDERDIKKHKNDVFRLYRILDPNYSVSIPDSVRRDVSQFFDAMEQEPVDLKALGFPKNTLLSEVLQALRDFYA
jgi:hypothetical protein